LAKDGEESFYRCEIAERIEDDITAHGGFVTVKDLQSYTIREVSPIVSELNGFTIWTVPPEGGGAILIEIINILKREGFFNIQPYTVDFFHYLSQAAKLAFIDRMAYMGDGEFEHIDTYTAIFNHNSARKRYGFIQAERDIPTEEYVSKLHHEGFVDVPESGIGGSQTTHFSIVDDQGNAVSNSYTLNLRYGSKWTVEGTGVLMNGSTDSFSFVPGKPNYFGVIGNHMNLFEPNKRPASNMAPVLVTKGKDVHLLIGTPGGPTIPTSLAAILFAVLVYGISPAESIGEGRIHHQAWPDVLFREDDGRLDIKVKDLAAKGYTIKRRTEPIGDMHGIFRDERGYLAISDYRRGGVALSI
jgi:gamma-glutamyltranspeptidase/glutathione hydrolase